MAKSNNVLSIDGGGIKGLRPLYVLAEIEKRSGKKCVDLFQTMSGTSTGAFIVALLSLGYTAEQIIGLYFNLGKLIFKKSFLRFGIFRNKYSDRNLNEAIFNYFGDIVMSKAKSRLIIPAYNIDSRKDVIFDSHIDKGVKIFDVLRASASAQSYFKTHKIGADRFIDGGNVINNPSYIAWQILKAENFDSDVSVLSIGTGREELPIQKNRKGMVGWAKNTVDILMTEQAQMVHRVMVDNKNFGLIKNYYNISPDYHNASEKMDDASDENLNNLIKDGKSTVLKYSDSIDCIVEDLAI